MAYNLPEMINIAHNLKLKIKFCDLDHKSGLMNPQKLKADLKKNFSDYYDEYV